MKRAVWRVLALPLLLVVASTGCKPVFCWANPAGGDVCIPQETSAAP